MTAQTTEQRVVVIPPKASAEIQRSAKLLKVAAYCRVSTDQEEQESSYEAQISYYTEKISANAEWRMAGIFADEGITGTQAKKRPEFLKMIALCRRKKIDLVMTKSISRFARNTVDSLKYIRELKALGIAVIFEKENINTMTVDSEMMITLMSCFAQAESESISKNVSWGIRQSFKSGNVPMQYSRLLGYKKGEDGNPEIVPEEAQIVREIYEKYLDGHSLDMIVESLNSRGLLTKGGGKPYSKASIKSILTNEKYTGDALLQKTYITDCISKKTRKNNGELPKYLVQNHHEAIIPREQFNRVQMEMTRRSSKRKVAEKLTKTEQGKYSAKFALTELLVCGECGTPYRRVTWTAKGYKEVKWRCINRLQYGKKMCHNSPTMDEESLHKAIVSAINSFGESKGSLKEILQESIAEELDPNLNGSVQAAKARIEELTRNIDELIMLATTTTDNDSAMSDIEKFSREMTDLRAFIENEKAKQATAQQNTEQLQEIMHRLDTEDFTVTEYDDTLVRRIVERVTVAGKYEIVVRFKGGCEIRRTV